MTAAIANPVVAEAAAKRGRRISLGRLILMMTLTCGIYWPYWMYRNRRHYRDYTGDHTTEPVWHGLTQLVPIYEFFRWHNHVSSWRHATGSTGAPVTFSPDTAVILSVAASFLSLAGIPLLIIAACLLQKDLNRHWEWHDREYDSGASQAARIGIGEILCIPAGIVWWSVTLGMWILWFSTE